VAEKIILLFGGGYRKRPILRLSLPRHRVPPALRALCAFPSRCGANGCSIVIAVALFFVALTAAAGTEQLRHADSTSSDARQARFWSVTLNGVDRREVVLFYLLDGKVLAAGKDLQRWRLRLPADVPQVVKGETFYPLDALRGTRYNIDESTQSIAIEVPGDQFIASTISNATASPTPTRFSWGGFLNYDITLQYNLGVQSAVTPLQAGSLTELGIFNGWGVGTTTVLGRNFSNTAEFVRLDSTWTHDMPESMSSLRFGDAISQPGEWGDAVRFGGIQWATNFATQPRFIRYPLPAFAGEAVLPSTVDVYLNNVRQLSKDVPVGPFTLTDLPAMIGQGDARIVVRDLLGREQVITQSYYMTPSLLSEGVQNYSYEIGLIRQNYGLSSLDYGRAFVSGTHRYGFSNRFTGEAHGELLQRQQTLGISGSYLWDSIGLFSLSLAGSHSHLGLGPYAALGFQRQGRWLSISGMTQRAGKDFTRTGLQPEQLAPREVSTASASISLGSYGSVNLSYIHQDNRSQADNELVNASYNLTLGKLGALSLNFFRSLVGEPNNTVSLIFTVPLGENLSANAYGSIKKDYQHASVQIQKNLPRGNGYGYRLLASVVDNKGLSDLQKRFDGALTMQNDVGLYSIEASTSAQQSAFRGGISGGIATMGGAPLFSRRLTDSFALVHVEDLPNVRVYADNQLVGFTNDNGDVLVPRMRPYQSNPIRIEQADLPLDVKIDSLQAEAVPYYRSGYEITMPLKRSRGAILTLVLTNGQPMPAGAIVRIIGQKEEFPVALKGEVYITSLKASNRLQALWKEQSCEFEVVYPKTDDPLPDLGSFTCAGVTP
jgi:outer membrane usher protein